MTKLLQHHEKYKEIHGEEKLVPMDMSMHKLLHIKLRKEGRCNTSTDELFRFTMRSYVRRVIRYIRFIETLDTNIELYEQYAINTSTNHINVSTFFRGVNARKILYID